MLAEARSSVSLDPGRQRPRFLPHLEYVASLRITFEQPEMIGETPDGIRCNFFVARGTVTGPRIQGGVLPRSVDHMIVRRDGVGEVRVRAAIRTNDGIMLSAEYQGVCDWGKEGYGKLCNGELPDTVDVRSTPRFFTGDAAHEWMNRTQFVGVGRVWTRELLLEYDLFALQLQDHGY